MDQFVEIKSLLPMIRFETIFDIGANMGQSLRRYRKAFPDARVFSFEPVPQTFEALKARVNDDKNVQLFQMAFGEKQSAATMLISEKSVSNRIVEKATSGLQQTISVEVQTGDLFCASNAIETINFLKIDTEGHDLRVCKGFAGMLADSRVDLLQVEAGLSPKNKLHVPFMLFKDYLEPLGYFIFRVYDQAGAPIARRCNVVFISPKQAQLNHPKRTPIKP